MRTSTSQFRIRVAAAAAIIAAMALWSFGSAGAAEAASVLSGPIDLGTSATYGVLGGSAITNTGPTVVTGDIGVSPSTSISGFGGAPGLNSGAVHSADPAAAQAQADLTTAFNTAAGLTPTSSGLAELNGMSLTPGVYSGGSLSLANNGTLTLAGTSASSIWVFQAASSLIIGSATSIVITGGATACNVFWEVGSSATIGTSAHFQGTVLAADSISAKTGASVIGRLLASTAAVTLDSNPITVPSSCAPGSPPISTNSPAFTSGAPSAARVGTPFSFALTASGFPSPTFSVSSGTLPAGLVMNSTTGVISGIPTSSGASTFTVTATNGSAPDVSTLITIAAAGPVLAETGVDATVPLALASALLAGGALLLLARRRRPQRRH
jgi:LPXTG-motif cell wall-anchored protein